ncbi:hypothetical protein AX15_004535 [Amanita polypyramis BW_CC]|nr:hypothetical protein AX15_004535 [Amanita polypyramis BW_CC]
MSPSRASPAVRSPSPNTTPWPSFSAPTTSSATPDANSSTNTRPGDSPSRSAKKIKGRARQDRVPEEDIRFNIGPKSPRAMLARRLMRRTRPERVIDPYTMDIPDYPPPSFQEAISSPALSISPTAAVSHTPPQPSITDTDAREHDNEAEADSSPRNAHIVEPPPSVVSDSDSGSDSSHDFYHVPHVKVKDGQHGLTFPSAALRGRTKSHRDDLETDEYIVHAVSATRRHNSLSPLRTLFPSLHFTLHDRAASAHPTTESTTSPYPLSRGMSSFFRSTTSLALLHGNGNTTPTTLKSKSSMTNLSSNAGTPKRKLFSPCKGKERPDRVERSERLEIDPEMDHLDTWEVIDATEADGPEMSPESEKCIKKGNEGKEEWQSSDVSLEGPATEPFKEAIQVSAVPISTEEQALQPPQQAAHPLSLRDRKTPIPSAERVQRSPQSAPPRSSSPPPSRAIHLPEVLSPKFNNGPPITVVRSTRRQTTGPPHILTTKRSQVLNSSPLGTQTWKPDEESPITGVLSDADTSLVTALETPLPPTPIENVGSTSHAPTSKPRLGYSNEFQSFIADTAGLQFTLSTDSFTTAVDTSGSANGVETASKKHYHGRPLPPAPGSGGSGARVLVDPVCLTVTSSPENEASKEKKGKRANCPEGLLIDLDDNTFMSGMSTPEAARSQVDLLLPPSPTPSSMPGFPMIGCGHGQLCGHLTSASVSTPNLASQPIFPTPLHVVSMTPSQSQSSPGPHVWSPLCAITADSRWACDCRVEQELPEYEVSVLLEHFYLNYLRVT